MSPNRYAKKRDAVEREIFAVLRQCGFSVEPMDTPVDAFVSFRGRCWPVEIKTGKKKLNENQKAFVERCRGPKLVVLRDEHEAIDWACQVATEAA